MRSFHRDTISDEDLQSIIDLQATQSRHDFDVASKIPSFKQIMELVEQTIEEQPIWDKPSYFRVENLKRAHPLHYDGCTLEFKPNHMAWCRYSAVSVLTKDFTGGTLHFKNPDLELNKEIYKSTIIYSSNIDNDPQLHSRDAHDGNRYALLMFLATR